jgi:hypothetical protein
MKGEKSTRLLWMRRLAIVLILLSALFAACRSPKLLPIESQRSVWAPPTVMPNPLQTGSLALRLDAGHWENAMPYVGEDTTVTDSRLYLSLTITDEHRNNIQGAIRLDSVVIPYANGSRTYTLLRDPYSSDHVVKCITVKVDFVIPREGFMVYATRLAEQELLQWKVTNVIRSVAY